MTQAELYTHLKSIGLPIAYNHFESPPSIPYMVYRYTGSNDFLADNKNYHDVSSFTVELYTRKKDLATEKLIEDKFKALELPYTDMESWIESDKLFQIAYEIQI